MPCLLGLAFRMCYLGEKLLWTIIPWHWISGKAVWFNAPPILDQDTVKREEQPRNLEDTGSMSSKRKRRQFLAGSRWSPQPVKWDLQDSKHSKKSVIKMKIEFMGILSLILQSQSLAFSEKMKKNAFHITVQSTARSLQPDIIRPEYRRIRPVFGDRVSRISIFFIGFHSAWYSWMLLLFTMPFFVSLSLHESERW